MSDRFRSRMRAVAGICSYTQPQSTDRLSAMLRAMTGSDAGVFLASPEMAAGFSEYGSGPARYPIDERPARVDATAGPTLVADLRIDNRDELIPELDLPPTASDDDLLARAWRRWGFSTVDHLIGGFAFACWDPRLRTLFLARDHAGERPLHFTRAGGPGGSFAFASMPSGLCALPGVGDRIHVGQLVHFVAALTLPDTSAFFEGMERLPPAHWAKVSPAGVEVRRYWHPIHAKAIRYRKDSEYIDDFRERFDRAVAARLSGEEGIGSQLSGGLDSSSVTATAARLLAARGRRLPAFTAVPQSGYDGAAIFGRFGNEGPAAAEVATLYPNVDHVLVNASGRDMIAACRRNARLSGQPTFNPTNLLWLEAILDGARSRGLGVVLQGTRGNATVSFGGLIGLSESFRRGQWLRFLNLARTLRANGHTSWRGALSWATGGLLPAKLRRLYHPEARNFSLGYSAVHPRIAAEYDLKARAMADFFNADAGTEAMRRNMYEYFDPGVDNGAAAAGWQIEQRDPTEDKRIFDFCYGIPIEQYLAGGQSRSLIRRAMEGRLPESTLRRTTRGLQSADWYMTVEAALPALSAELSRIERSPLARHILDTARLRTLLGNWPRSGYDTAEVHGAWHLALTRGIAAGSFIAEHDPDISSADTEEPGASPGS